MTKKIKPEDNSANIKNPNDGTDGTNEQYDKAELNRRKQIDENKKKK